MQTDPRTNLSNQLAQTLSNRVVEPDEKREITITFRVSYAEKTRLEQRCNGVVYALNHNVRKILIHKLEKS